MDKDKTQKDAKIKVEQLSEKEFANKPDFKEVKITPPPKQDKK